MPDVFIPTWQDVQGLASAAKSQLLICTPYYSEEGVGRVFDVISDPGPRLEFWTRLSPSDWVSGASQPDELLALCQLFAESQGGAELHVSQRLHAKAYAADNHDLMVGSANLSAGGFDVNIELMVRFRDDEAAAQIAKIRHEFAPHLKLVDLDGLADWVASSQETVDTARSEATKEPEALGPVREQLDRLLGFGGGAPIEVEASERQIEAFGRWLLANRGLAGADVLYARYTGNDRQNLTGHFKQCFFGAWRFLHERPEFVEQLLGEFADFEPPPDVFQPSQPIVDAWNTHIDQHATDQTDDYSYPILRGYLPRSYGGTVTGGGGGISTIKRMLPLVAEYLKAA